MNVASPILATRKFNRKNLNQISTPNGDRYSASCILHAIILIRYDASIFGEFMLENLIVDRIVVHEVHKRGTDRRMIQPDFATQLENLSQDAMDAFRMRVTTALSAKAKCVEMSILNFGENSFLEDAASLMHASDEDFLSGSQSIPNRLAASQTSQIVPGGMVIVFKGTSSAVSAPFVGVIKAEVQDGFRRRKSGTTITTEFVNDLFLTKATRLYKIGFMLRTDSKADAPDGWKALVFDQNIIESNREAASHYFYDGFLGCGFPEDSAYETAKFFNLTKEFVSKNVHDSEKRHDVNVALYTFIKTDVAQTFTCSEFAERYMPVDLQDNYEKFMVRKHFPERAIKRDISDIKRKLKRRQFKYGSDILFSASPEAMSDGRARIKTLPRKESDDPAKPPITQITITAPFTEEK